MCRSLITLLTHIHPIIQPKGYKHDRMNEFCEIYQTKLRSMPGIESENDSKVREQQLSSKAAVGFGNR